MLIRGAGIDSQPDIWELHTSVSAPQLLSLYLSHKIYVDASILSVGSSELLASTDLVLYAPGFVMLCTYIHARLGV